MTNSKGAHMDPVTTRPDGGTVRKTICLGFLAAVMLTGWFSHLILARFGILFDRSAAFCILLPVVWAGGSLLWLQRADDRIGPNGVAIVLLGAHATTAISLVLLAVRYAYGPEGEVSSWMFYAFLGVMMVVFDIELRRMAHDALSRSPALRT